MKTKLSKTIFSILIISALSFSRQCPFLHAQEELLDIPVESEEALETQQADESELLSLDFENTEIRDVIRVLSEISGKNIVISPDIKATVTVQLKDVTWETALDVILKTYNLTYKKEENLIRVLTFDQMKVEEEKIPLVTKIIALNFAKAEDIRPSLEKMQSSRGSMEVNIRTNSLIITDLPEVVQQIEDIAEQLDTRTPQVMIEALMADVKLTADEALGIDWTMGHPQDTHEMTMSQTLASSVTNVAGSIAFGKTIFQDTDLAGVINAWQEDKRVDILANPKVLTLDNLQATIEMTEQIPYTSQSESTEGGTVTSTQFKDAGIKLFVTPHITTKDNWISMNVQVEQSFRSGWTPANEPIIDYRKADTNLMVKDGETIVIGGLRKKEDTVTIDKVPIFGDIPLLGVLFRKTTKSITNVDLLIFITPRIVEDPRLTIKEQETLELFKEEPEVDKALLKESEKKKHKGKPEPESFRPIEPSLFEETFSLRPPSE